MASWHEICNGMKANRKMVRDEKQKTNPICTQGGGRAEHQARLRIFSVSQVPVLRDGF
jgi:hypothetical protein